jgi:DNA helicase HerA-like ATPase
MYLKYVRETNHPELNDFIAFLENSVSSESWMLLRSGKARDKLFSLVGRLSELAEGAMGEIFSNHKGSETRVEKLLSRNVVLNLTGLDTDRDANILTWLILKKIYDYRKRKPNKSLPHVIVCEEAHNIAPAKFEGQETIIEKMLREMRKFGESIWLIDQRPLAVSRETLGLCGTIICLRLQYSSDVEKIGDTMHLNEKQKLKLQELEQGEAIVLLPRMKTAIPVAIEI